MTDVSHIFLVISFGLLAIIGIVVCFVVILQRIFINSGKLSELMGSYPAENQPQGMVLKKQTIGLGRSIRFRKCVRVCISQEGLYLAFKVIFGKEMAFLIPWSAITHVVETQLYGLNALSFSVGLPTITSIKVYPEIFAEIKPFLPRQQRKI